MPVNFQQIQNQVKDMGRQAKQHQEKFQDALDLALSVLEKYADQLEVVKQRIEDTVAQNSSLRCAIPVNEPLNISCPFLPLSNPPVLLAADGSQVNPDRNDPVEFSVINIGAIRTIPGSQQTPREIVKSRLLYFEDLENESGHLTEEIVALRRDLFERTMLADLAEAEIPPVLTLTDGPLELFREPKEASEYQHLFVDYLAALRRLAAIKSISAGYVDKPRADLVVRLLELMDLPQDELGKAGHKRPLCNINDADLFAVLLQPGQRSALFAIQSSSANRFEGLLALHFFYLNVGRIDHPYLARVEIPAWVAQDATLVNILHASLIVQCQQTGNRPYPYALHRAHEIALVTYIEKQQVEDMIILELHKQGIKMSYKSHKQGLKDTTGSKTRYPR